MSCDFKIPLWRRRQRGSLCTFFFVRLRARSVRVLYLPPPSAPPRGQRSRQARSASIKSTAVECAARTATAGTAGAAGGSHAAADEAEQRVKHDKAETLKPSRILGRVDVTASKCTLSLRDPRRRRRRAAPRPSMHATGRRADGGTFLWWARHCHDCRRWKSPACRCARHQAEEKNEFAMGGLGGAACQGRRLRRRWCGGASIAHSQGCHLVLFVVAFRPSSSFPCLPRAERVGSGPCSPARPALLTLPPPFLLQQVLPG